MTTETTEVVAPEATQEVASPVATTTNEAPAAPAADDYSYVPKKFLDAEGKPDFKKLAGSYTGLEKKLSAKGNIPASSVEEFEWSAPEGVDLGFSDEDQAAFKAEALANGFTAKQYEFMMSKYASTIPTQEASRAALKEAWGADFETQHALAQRAFEEFAPSNVSMNDPVFDHPAVLQLLARMGAELGEDSIAGKASPSPVANMSEAEVHALIASKDYWDSKEKQAKVTAWYQRGVK